MYFININLGKIKKKYKCDNFKIVSNNGYNGTVHGVYLKLFKDGRKDLNLEVSYDMLNKIKIKKVVENE